MERQFTSKKFDLAQLADGFVRPVLGAKSAYPFKSRQLARTLERLD
jgi:hypothetical protein